MLHLPDTRKQMDYVSINIWSSLPSVSGYSFWLLNHACWLVQLEMLITPNTERFLVGKILLLVRLLEREFLQQEQLSFSLQASSPSSTMFPFQSLGEALVHTIQKLAWVWLPINKIWNSNETFVQTALVLLDVIPGGSPIELCRYCSFQYYFVP